MNSDLQTSEKEKSTVVVLDFIAACNARDIEKMVSYFDDETVYHNIPLEPIVGVQSIRAVLEPFITKTSEVDWVVKQIAETDNGVVLTERLDRFLIDDQWLELPVMGVFEVEGQTIKAWRDYFELEHLRGGAKTS